MISLSGCMAGGITMVIRLESVPRIFFFENMIIRDKFSASNYWKDCVKYKVCTDYNLAKEIKFFVGDSSPVHWGDLPLPDQLALVPWRKYSSSQNDVWKWVETWHLDPVCFQVDLILWNPKVPKVEQHLFRFGIQDISEFYGSTEGNSNIINFDNTVGAVGFVPVLFAGILPLGPIKVGNQESYLSFW